MIPSFLSNGKSNRTAYNEALAHRSYTLDEEQCKRLIIKVFENYVLADRENAFLLSLIKYTAGAFVLLSVSLVIGWILNYMLAKKHSRNAPQPGTNIIDGGDYAGCIPILLQKLIECKIYGIEKHKYVTEMMVAHQNNDFEAYAKCKCNESDDLDLPNMSEEDDVFESTQSTDSQSQSSSEDDLPHLNCAAQKIHLPRRSTNFRVTKI